jgi:hypothetical protein
VGRVSRCSRCMGIRLAVTAGTHSRVNMLLMSTDLQHVRRAWSLGALVHAQRATGQARPHAHCRRPPSHCALYLA